MDLSACRRGRIDQREEKGAEDRSRSRLPPSAPRPSSTPAVERDGSITAGPRLPASLAGAVDRTFGEWIRSAVEPSLKAWERASTAPEVRAAATTTKSVDRQDGESWMGEMDLEELRMGSGGVVGGSLPGEHTLPPLAGWSCDRGDRPRCDPSRPAVITVTAADGQAL
jgi:hypothetical protein